jgi:hypothetical protein
MVGRVRWSQGVVLAGVGSQVVAAELDTIATLSGRVEELVLRQDLGGGATGVDAYVTHSGSSASAPVAPVATPDYLDAPVIETAHVPTASAKVASLVESYAAGAVFNGRLRKWVLLNVTGAGAWTINVLAAGSADA